MKKNCFINNGINFALSACVEPLQIKAESKTSAALGDTAHNYQCQSGEKIVVDYQSTETILLQYQGSHYKMSAAISASGSRYITNDIEWWTKGRGAGAKGTLFRHLTDGGSAQVIESCTGYFI